MSRRARRSGIDWTFLVVLFLGGGGGLFAAPDPAGAPLTFAEAVAEARAKNPTLAAARLQGEVDRAGAAVAGEWPNPEARYERTNELPHVAYGLAEVVELPWKRARRVAVARAAVDGGAAELLRVEREVEGDVRGAFFKLADAQRRGRLVQELRQIAARARAAAAARFDAGDVPRLDVLQADLALLQAENEATAQDGSRRAAAAVLAAQIGRDPAVDLAVADEVPTSPLPELDAALADAVAHNAGLLVLERQVAQAEARTALARAERWPDPTLEGALTHRAEPEFTWGWRAAVAVTLPLFTTHGAQVKVEEASAVLARAQREALERGVRAEVAAALYRAAAQRQQYLRYRDEILPRSREVEDMAQESYETGQTALPAMLQALQSAREVRTQALQAQADYESALVDLARASNVGSR
jgi:cobalt-zinc-cadmium efflux system outer membrane protein